MKNEVVALSLFSGGLDSILASRVVAEQGIEVIAIKFVSPFFDYNILQDIDGYKNEVMEKYGLNVVVEDISKQYLELLHNPAHGFGKNFNPCIDCKIFMFTRAREMMREFDASFLITGEVVGQRPMSQRRDTLNVIERDSGNRAILLRPLSAKLMKETDVEVQGLVDREKLLDFSGRGRSRQIALAREFGITEFPAPAGGCRLADPILSKRIANIYSGNFVVRPEEITAADILCLMVGRQFLLPGGGWLVLGRDEEENNKIIEYKQVGDITVTMEDHPGPTAILRRPDGIYQDKEKRDADIQFAAGLVVRYGKKVAGKIEPQDVHVYDGDNTAVIYSEPIADTNYPQWMVSAKG